MRFAVSITVVPETQEAVADSKLPKQGGAITALTAHTQPVLSWAGL